MVGFVAAVEGAAVVCAVSSADKSRRVTVIATRASECMMLEATACGGGSRYPDVIVAPLSKYVASD